MRRHLLAPATCEPLRWLSALFLLLHPGLATAGGSGAQQRELLLFEEQPITAASKHAQSARDAPARVTVITREEIERFGYRTLAEALRAVPGFHLSGDRAYDHIGVRGFLRPNDSNDRILVLVNGHTSNNDIYQQAYLGQDFGVDLEAIDHIEVIRGPGSALYGGNAFFAVVNVVTTTAQDTPGVQALAETGSFGRKRGQASVGHVTAGGLDTFASGSVLDVDGPERLFYPAYDSPATNNGVAHNADAERALKLFTSARYGGLSFQGGTNWREKHIPTGAFGTTFNDSGTKTVDARHFGELLYQAPPLAQTEITGRLYYDGARYHGTYVYGAGPSRLKNEDLGRSDWFGAEVRGRRDLFKDNALTVGSEYTYHPQVVQQNFDLPTHRTYLDDVRSFGTLGVYAQDEWRVVPDLMLVGGLRYDHYYTRLQQVSPRFGAIWTATDRTAVKLLFGQAFRPPNLYEQYYAYPSIGVQSVASPRLDAEHITTYEAIVEQQLGSVAQATLAGYHNEISDLIEQVQLQRPGFNGSTFQFRNTGSAAATGAEAEVRVPLPRGVLVRAAYSLQEARDEHHRPLSNSPEHLGEAGLLFPVVAGLDGAAELILVGPRRTLAGRRLEADHILNLNFTYRTPVPNLRLTAGLYNILNQSYPDPGGNELRQDRIPQDGFTFRVQLRYAF